LFYNAADSTKVNNGLSDAQLSAWTQVLSGLNGVNKTDVNTIVSVFRNAGDSVMQRL